MPSINFPSSALSELIKLYTFSAVSWKSLPNTILTVEYEASCIIILGFLFSVMLGFHFSCESLVSEFCIYFSLAF